MDTALWEVPSGTSLCAASSSEKVIKLFLDAAICKQLIYIVW